MSTIGFWMLHEEGHIMPTLRLASSLRARGHRVCYFAIPDHEALVVGHGFELVPIYEELYPRGALARAREPSAAELMDRTRAWLRLQHTYFLDGVADELLHRVAPDLLLCDVLEMPPLVAARYWSIPVLRVSTSLPQTPAPGVPPLTSGLPFDDSPAGVAAAERDWDERLRAEAEGEMFALYKDLNDRVELRYQFPRALMDSRSTFSAHLVGFPELVLCTPALDYPRPPDPSRHYGESLWLERSEPAFPWHALDDRPLLYCTLGSQAHRVAGARRFFSELLALAAAAPRWQLVLAAGERLARALLADPSRIPGNAVVVPFAPQLALLRRSRLAITHGGLGTLKECMFLGVPVLVFPGQFDQPGNAARVTYHRLGQSGDFHTATAAEIRAMAERVLGDPDIPRRVAAVQAALRELEESQPGLALVERLLSSR